MKIFSVFAFILLITFGQAQTLLGPEAFNSDNLVHGSTAPTTVWFAPNYYTPIDYNSTGGCSGGYAGFQGNWISYWMNFFTYSSS